MKDFRALMEEQSSTVLTKNGPNSQLVNRFRNYNDDLNQAQRNHKNDPDAYAEKVMHVVELYNKTAAVNGLTLYYPDKLARYANPAENNDALAA